MGARRENFRNLADAVVRQKGLPPSYLLTTTLTSLLLLATKGRSKRLKPDTALRSIEQLKAIPILQVAQSLGMKLVKTGSGMWQQREIEGSSTSCSSLTIFEKTNTFVRFSGTEQGGCSKGTNIDLVRHLHNNSSVHDACEFLRLLR